MTRRRILNGMLALLSAAVSIAWIGFGASVFFSPEPPLLALIFGAFLLVYGLATLVLLGVACRHPSAVLAQASKLCGIALFAILFAGSLDTGRISGLELALLTVAGGALWIQFVAVRRLVGGQGV